jgi:mRNA interferase MazF
LVEKIKCAIEAIVEPKRRGMVINWLASFCRYLHFEKQFEPSWLKKYRPGDIIDMDFGMNIGAEFGGVHFAVVVEENSRKDSNVVVVPLASYDLSDPPDKSHQVDLGVIPELNTYRGGSKKGTRAIVKQIRATSKMRIYYPKKTKEQLYRLSAEELDKIYAKIIELYSKKY